MSSARRLRALEFFAQGIAELIAEEREAGVREIYSTKAGQEPPEYVGRHREWVRLCSTLRGAYKANRSARWWSIRRADYEAHLTAQTPKPAPANEAAEAWTPAVAMADLRLRASGGRR